MDERARAEDHLRAIRSLMERATIYRAISAPSALVGGLLSLLLAISLMFRPVQQEQVVILCWLVVLLLTAAVNVYFLWRGARDRDEPFASRGMREALRALIPSFLVAGVLTALCLAGRGFDNLPVIWSVCYGLALLATSHFAPPSIIRLGTLFLLTGLAMAVAESIAPAVIYKLPMAVRHQEHWGSFYMALTFGLYHIAYAALTWRSASRNSATALALTPDA